MTGLPETWERYAVESECTGCGASRGGCDLKHKFSGRVCCLACNHPVTELEAS